MMARGRLWYAASLIAAAAFTLLHALHLPLVVTYDGHLYVELADVFGTARYPEDWDFLRTPLYPVCLKIAFALFGRKPIAAIAVGAVLGFAGLWLLASALYRAGHRPAACALPIVGALYPLLVAYEHCLLTETGTFCGLALLVRVSGTPRGRSSWWDAAAIAAAVSAGYYMRPSLLHLALAAALLHAVNRLWQEPAPLSARRGRQLILQCLAIAAVPYLVAWPWNREMRESGRTDDVWLFGMTKQALIPPGDPLLGDAEELYAKAIRESTVHGHLDVGGVLGAPAFEVQVILTDDISDAGAVFRRMVIAHPARYLAGVGRSLLLFAGARPIESENGSYLDQVLERDRTTIHLGPERLRDSIRRDFDEEKRPSPIGPSLARLIEPYRVLLLVAVWLLPVTLFLGIRRRQPVLLALGGLPAAFLVLHALTLLSLDRYAFPAYPLLLGALLATAGQLAHDVRAWFRREDGQRVHAPGSALRAASAMERSQADIEYHQVIAAQYDAVVVAPRSVCNAFAFARFAWLVTAGRRMLDLGCGTGHMTVRFGRRFDQVVGVDHSEAMLAQAARNAHDAGVDRFRAVQSDAFRFLSQQEAGTFDFVSCTEFVRHLRPEDVPRLFAEVARVLRTNGLVLLQESIDTGRRVPRWIERWNARSVATRTAHSGAASGQADPREAPIRLPALLQALTSAGLEVAKARRSWELFPRHLPPTAGDWLAIGVFSFAFGRAGNVVTLAARKARR
jgi:ubiquinone/menaquinone biosynthesis C-methylase UbiE